MEALCFVIMSHTVFSRIEAALKCKPQFRYKNSKQEPVSKKRINFQALITELVPYKKA